MKNGFRDVKTMFWRCLIILFRNPMALSSSFMIPAILLLVFVHVFGGTMNVGDFNYVNYLVPGIIVNSLLQASVSTAQGVAGDMKKGIVNRFRTMAINKSSLLGGHSLAALVKTIITSFVVFVFALLSGFRPTATICEWFVIMGLIILMIFAATWFAIFVGTSLQDLETTRGIMSLVPTLVFLSSGFAPTENMPRILGHFAEYQPMTPYINTLRSLMNGNGLGDNLHLALIWWIGIMIFCFIASVMMYMKKLTV